MLAATDPLTGDPRCGSPISWPAVRWLPAATPCTFGAVLATPIARSSIEIRTLMFHAERLYTRRVYCTYDQWPRLSLRRLVYQIVASKVRLNRGTLCAFCTPPVVASPFLRSRFFLPRYKGPETLICWKVWWIWWEGCFFLHVSRWGKWPAIYKDVLLYLETGYRPSRTAEWPSAEHDTWIPT